MAKHRSHSIEFKRQVAQEFLAGETLHGLAKRHDLSRNLVRVWVTYYGKVKEPRTMTTSGRPFTKSGGGVANKRAIVALVERGGKVRSFHMKDHPTVESVRDVIVRTASRKSALHTDESRLYISVGKEFAGHETVNHSAEEYERGDVTTNTIEGYFSIFKRGMNGVYQHCSEKHLHRYLTEFDFRYNARIALGVDDTDRTVRALKGAAGKRLTYQQSRKGKEV